MATAIQAGRGHYDPADGTRICRAGAAVHAIWTIDAGKDRRGGALCRDWSGDGGG